jgi:hypothetical protein
MMTLLPIPLQYRNALCTIRLLLYPLYSGTRHQYSFNGKDKQMPNCLAAPAQT